MESNFLAQKLLFILTKQRKKTHWHYAEKLIDETENVEFTSAKYLALCYAWKRLFQCITYLVLIFVRSFDQWIDCSLPECLFNWFWMGVLVDKCSIHLFFLLMIRLSPTIVKISCITSAFYAWLGYKGFYN